MKQRNELSSNDTDGLAFLQGGLGLMIKVNFPSLSELLLYERGTILEAELTLSLLNNSYEQEDLPKKLILHESNKLNQETKLLVDSKDESLQINDLYNEQANYSFDITNFFHDELSDNYVDPNKGILITLPPSYNQHTLTQIIIDASSKNTNLKLYYIEY